MDILPDWYQNNINTDIELPSLYIEKYSLDVFRYYILGRDISRPYVPLDHWYEVMSDLYTLCDFLNIWYVSRPMEREILDIFMRDNVNYHTYSVDVNIILALLDIRFLHSLHRTFERVLNESDTDDIKEIKRQWRNELKQKIPFCLRHVVPRRFRELYHIAYPSFDIKCVRSLIQPTKIVNTEPKYDRVYAVRYDTLKARLIRHLPPVMTGSDFPWFIEGSACCVAGGFLQCLSNDILYDEGLYKTSDVDVFITGYEERSRVLLERILTLLSSRGYEFEYNNNVINAIPQEGNVIQIICTLNRDAYDIITTFDNSSVQIAYMGDIYEGDEEHYTSDIICSLDWQKYIQYGQAFVRYNTTGYRIDKMVKRYYVPIREGRLWRKNLERTYDIIDGRYINYMYELEVNKTNVTYSKKINQYSDIMFLFFKSSTYELQDIIYKNVGQLTDIYSKLAESYRGIYNGLRGVLIHALCNVDGKINYLWNKLFRDLISNKDKLDVMDNMLDNIMRDTKAKNYIKYCILERPMLDKLDPRKTLRKGLEDWYPTTYMYVYNKMLEYIRVNRMNITDNQYKVGNTYTYIIRSVSNLNINDGSFYDIMVNKHNQIIHVSTPMIRE